MYDYPYREIVVMNLFLSPGCYCTVTFQFLPHLPVYFLCFHSNLQIQIWIVGIFCMTPETVALQHNDMTTQPAPIVGGRGSVLNLLFFNSYTFF
jgi:uncharacterized membrane protein